MIIKTRTCYHDPTADITQAALAALIILHSFPCPPRASHSQLVLGRDHAGHLCGAAQAGGGLAGAGEAQAIYYPSISEAPCFVRYCEPRAAARQSSKPSSKLEISHAVAPCAGPRGIIPRHSHQLLRDRQAVEATSSIELRNLCVSLLPRSYCHERIFQ